MRIDIWDDETIGMNTNFAIKSLIKTFGGPKTVMTISLNLTTYASFTESRVPFKIVLENKGIKFRIRAFSYNLVTFDDVQDILKFCGITLSPEEKQKIFEKAKYCVQWRRKS